MVQLMVGRDVSQYYSHSPSYSDEVVLKVDRLRTTAFPAHELSFDVKRGEIVGVSGLVGAGRTEMLQAIFASVPKVSGSVRVLGEEIDGNSTIDVIRAGVALVPEDRKLHGLVIDMSVKENMSPVSYTQLTLPTKRIV